MSEQSERATHRDLIFRILRVCAYTIVIGLTLTIVASTFANELMRHYGIWLAILGTFTAAFAVAIGVIDR